MKNQNLLSKDFEGAINCTPLSILKEAGFISKIGKRLKMVVFIGSMAGIGLFQNSCKSGYVATEPTYAEYSRPQRPGVHHVWIDGNWVYNHPSHAYVQKSGYWTRPQQNRAYVKGSWQSTPKGKYWKKGRWEKNNHHKNRHSE